MKLKVKLNQLERENLLTNAEITHCIGYWVDEFQSIKYSPIDKPDYRLISLTVRLGEDAPEPFKVVTIDHKTIQKGIDILFQTDGYEHIKSAVIEDDADIETTDVIIQFGVFGELIYA